VSIIEDSVALEPFHQVVHLFVARRVLEISIEKLLLTLLV